MDDEQELDLADVLVVAGSVADRYEGGPASSDIWQELRTAIDGARRVEEARLANDRLAAYAFFRVALETLLRLWWLSGAAEDATFEGVTRRLSELRRRDAMRLRRALELVPDAPQRDDALAALDALLAESDTKAAPATIEGLGMSPYGALLYGAHRLCSAIIHPGLGIRSVDSLDVRYAARMTAIVLDQGVAIAAACAGVVDRGSSTGYFAAINSARLALTKLDEHLVAQGKRRVPLDLSQYRSADRGKGT